MTTYRLVPEPPKPGMIPPVVRSNLTLWQVFQSPPALQSILIDDAGVVTEKQNPLNKDTKAAKVFIPGGHQFYCEKDDFAYTALVAAGYTLEEVT